jgi:hypothetical protein
MRRNVQKQFPHCVARVLLCICVLGASLPATEVFFSDVAVSIVRDALARFPALFRVPFLCSCRARAMVARVRWLQITAGR